MISLILRTMAPTLVGIIVLYSFYVLVRGHDDPGGGFIGGLIAASALATYGLAFGPRPLRRALRIDPIRIAGFGLFLAVLAALLPAFTGDVFFTALWHIKERFDIPLSSPLLFDAGVYLIVLGSVVSLALSMAEDN